MDNQLNSSVGKYTEEAVYRDSTSHDVIDFYELYQKILARKNEMITFESALVELCNIMSRVNADAYVPFVHTLIIETHKCDDRDGTCIKFKDPVNLRSLPLIPSDYVNYRYLYAEPNSFEYNIGRYLRYLVSLSDKGLTNELYKIVNHNITRLYEMSGRVKDNETFGKVRDAIADLIDLLRKYYGMYKLDDKYLELSKKADELVREFGSEIINVFNRMKSEIGDYISERVKYVPFITYVFDFGNIQVLLSLWAAGYEKNEFEADITIYKRTGIAKSYMFSMYFRIQGGDNVVEKVIDHYNEDISASDLEQYKTYILEAIRRLPEYLKREKEIADELTKQLMDILS